MWVSRPVPPGGEEGVAADALGAVDLSIASSSSSVVGGEIAGGGSEGVLSGGDNDSCAPFWPGPSTTTCAGIFVGTDAGVCAVSDLGLSAGASANVWEVPAAGDSIGSGTLPAPLSPPVALAPIPCAAPWRPLTARLLAAMRLCNRCSCSSSCFA